MIPADFLKLVCSLSHTDLPLLIVVSETVLLQGSLVKAVIMTYCFLLLVLLISLKRR